jgi:hypothetical protein
VAEVSFQRAVLVVWAVLRGENASKLHRWHVPLEEKVKSKKLYDKNQEFLPEMIA